MNWVRNLLTGKDNQTIDMGRVLWAVSLVSLVGNEAYAIGWHGQPFDPSAFATGCAAILAGGGAALGFKAHTEPGN